MAEAENMEKHVECDPKPVRPQTVIKHYIKEFDQVVI